jgi:cofilin
MTTAKCSHSIESIAIQTIKFQSLRSNQFIALHSTHSNSSYSLMTVLTAIKLADECFEIWNQFRFGNKYHYIIFNFSNDLRYIVVEKTVDKSKTYDDLLDDLPPRDVRYVVYDFHFKADDGTDRNKLIFIVWAPDITPVKRKMLIASTKQSVKNSLSGISVEIQSTDYSEIQHDVVLSKVQHIIH